MLRVMPSARLGSSLLRSRSIGTGRESEDAGLREGHLGGELREVDEEGGKDARWRRRRLAGSRKLLTTRAGEQKESLGESAYDCPEDGLAGPISRVSCG